MTTYYESDGTEITEAVFNTEKATRRFYQDGGNFHLFSSSEETERDTEEQTAYVDGLVESKKEALFAEAMSRIASFWPEVDTIGEIKIIKMLWPQLSNPTQAQLSAKDCYMNYENRLNWLASADLTDPTVITQIENYDPATDPNWP